MKRSLPRSALGLTLAALAVPAYALAQDFETRTHTVQSPADAARAKANAALDAHDYAAAIKLLTALVADSPKDEQLLYDLASAEDALDQAVPAEATYRRAIEANPAALEPHLALGLLLARNARTADARSELLLASAAQGNPLLKARAFRSLARIDQKARPTDARDELLAALKLSPETPDDTLLTADLAAALPGNAVDAEAAYRRVLEQHAGDPVASAGLARMLAAAGRRADAEKLLSTAITTHAGDVVLTTQLAAVLHADGKDEQALPLMRGLHAANPNDQTVTRLLAGLLAASHEFAAAEALYAALHNAQPQDGLLTSDWADTLIRLKRFGDAQRVLTAAVAQPETFPGPADLGEAAGRLAFAASENHDPGASLQALALRATVLPTTPVMLFLTAIAHDRLHHTKPAQQAYKDFLRVANGGYPDEEFEARHRLLALERAK